MSDAGTEVEISRELGRFFEAGFNVGLLTCLQQRGLASEIVAEYRADLEQLNMTRLVERLNQQKGIISTEDRRLVDGWARYALQHGWIAGMTFLHEYLDAQEGTVVVRYFQCRFSGDNSLGLLREEDEEQRRWALLGQLGNVPDVVGAARRYKEIGEFLNADSLLLLEVGKQYRILAIDQSFFTMRDMGAFGDLAEVETMRDLLFYSLHHQRTRSLFAQLALDARPGEVLLEEGLSNYYQAFHRKDKEVYKLIQAGSYTYSFLDFLDGQQLIDPTRPLLCTLVGYSDRGLSTMNLGRAGRNVLHTCYEIYTRRGSGDVTSARKKLLDNIKSQAGRALGQGGSAFLETLLRTHTPGIHAIDLGERISGFTNTVGPIPPALAQALNLPDGLGFRQGHNELIQRALAPGQPPYLFLLGNPGIGKTTAVKDYLSVCREQDEGFLLLYVSPRTQVNLDILAKFRKLGSDTLLLHSDSPLIHDHGGKHTVAYEGGPRDGDGEFMLNGVQFVDVRRSDGPSRKSQPPVDQVTSRRMQETKRMNRGVLDSIFQAIEGVLREGDTQQIVAAASIQALKQTQGGRDTLDHFRKIFRGAYNKDSGVILPELQKISKRIPHLFIMIDEVTGDDAGAAFLSRIREHLNALRLFDPESGFNTKVIIADASLVESQIIAEHLKVDQPERDKIYVRKVTEPPAALSVEVSRFHRRPDTIINANSYPASALDLHYHVLLEVLHEQEIRGLTRRQTLADALVDQLAGDLLGLIEQEGTDQIILYMQDKERLGMIREQLTAARTAQGHPFEEGKQYLTIHADLLPYQRRLLASKETQEGDVVPQVKVVFMTSSASRGISFPHARHILVAVPRFSIEQNLMEIIQVIYRGRGEDAWDLKEKALHFYFTERAFYRDGEEPAASVQEGVLNLITMLLVLKTAIMTRVQGYGQVGRSRWLMIPVGGKSLSAAGQHFSDTVQTLLRELEKLFRQEPRHSLLQLHGHLLSLLSRSDIALGALKSGTSERSWLQWLEMDKPQPGRPAAGVFENGFRREVDRNLARLLDVPAVERAFVHGPLLLVPAGQREVETRYEIRLLNQIKVLRGSNFRNQLWAIASSRDEYPKNLCQAARDVAELLEVLDEGGLQWSQDLVQQDQRSDLYYAVPIFALAYRATLESYFKDPHQQEPENSTFHRLLSVYLRELYPIESALPISSAYGEFPFLVFRSQALGEMRRRIFTEHSLLSSPEFNVLNLILSRNP